jgi:hypothetical protein
MAAALLLAALCAIPSRAEDLKLLISVQQQSVVAPNPVRATLHFHNSGQQVLWLYRPVKSSAPSGQGVYIAPGAYGTGQNQAYGGSKLQVELVAQHAPAGSEQAAPGTGFVIAPDALPYPRLVRLAPGDDYEEKVNIHATPATTKSGATDQPVWGAYSFSVNYSADYSNAEAMSRDIHANLWHGEATSNTVTLQLQPPDAQGTIEGTVFGSSGRAYGGVLVTLSDDNENPIDQLYADDNGKFTFAHLPAGRYWLTVRDPGTEDDTSVFRHLDLDQGGAPATPEIMMLPVEINKAERVLHKPVLFHTVDSQGHPLAKVRLAILYSSGNVIEHLKTQTGQDGFAAISLIPGGNLVTMRMDGCKDVQRTAGVARGPGVDGFEFVYECARK